MTRHSMPKTRTARPIARRFARLPVMAGFALVALGQPFDAAAACWRPVAEAGVAEAGECRIVPADGRFDVHLRDHYDVCCPRKSTPMGDKARSAPPQGQRDAQAFERIGRLASLPWGGVPSGSGTDLGTSLPIHRLVAQLGIAVTCNAPERGTADDLVATHCLRQPGAPSTQGTSAPQVCAPPGDPPANLSPSGLPPCDLAAVVKIPTASAQPSAPPLLWLAYGVIDGTHSLDERRALLGTFIAIANADGGRDPTAFSDAARR